MAKVFLSTLGTNKYALCHYMIDGAKAPLTPFIQEALAAALCGEWREEDRVVVFCTEQARIKNWLDKEEGNPEGNFPEGLETRLRRLGLRARLEMRPVPDGGSEEEIMKIFMVVSDSLNDGDEVFLDITHSFRSLPLLNAVILNHAKIVKGVKVSGIHYGAFETLGPLPEVLKIPEEERTAPVFDLTPYDALLDWGRAVDDFVRHGWAQGMKDLVRRTTGPILKAREGRDETAKELNRLADRLDFMSRAVFSARCRDIERFDSLGDLVGDIEDQEVLPPLRPLMERIRRRTEVFAKASPEDKGFEAVRWCLEHNLVPQGYTILRETVVSGVCRLLGLDGEGEGEREGFVSSLLAVTGRGTSEDGWWGELAERREEALRIREELGEPFRRLAKTFLNIAEARNDINHGGCRLHSLAPQKLHARLEKALPEARDAWRALTERG